MNLDEIDKYCDQFEQVLKKMNQLSPKEFCWQQKVPEDERLMAELNRVAAEYSQAKSEPASTAAMPESTKVGETIGPYKLLQQIGEGGMGTVYMADQEAPVERRVALKVIKPGMGSKEVIARFESERQALAMMDHENIAKMFDAGTTDDGRPYFVMELVRGVPLTKFCDDNKLSIKERLELFITVCQAVQHAHQKGIIHRDIKPSNVLVSNYDGQPVPKIIDFGVAKAMQQKLTDKTLFTEFGRVIGTLQYMSPEQAGLSQLDIDTRSDIYSLGVLLYELLTGSTPIDKQRIRDVGWERVMQLIREEEPAKPSTKISESGDALSDISAQRHTRPNTLGSLVRGDLDWIVMKALEKDRSRRYETANGFAKDIERHLAGEIVQARPPSWTYRANRFVKKNRIAMTVAGAFAAFLIVATTVTTWLAIRATDAEHEAATALISERLASQQTRLALDTLTDSVIEEVFARQPELGDAERTYLRKVVQLYEELATSTNTTPETRLARAVGQARVASILAVLGELSDAEKGYEEALDQLVELSADVKAGGDPNFESNVLAKTASVRINYGILLRQLAETSLSADQYRQAAVIFESLSSTDIDVRNEHANALSNLATITTDREQSETLFQQAIDIQNDLLENLHGDKRNTVTEALAMSYFGLASARHKRREYDEAEGAYKKYIELFEGLPEAVRNQPKTAEHIAATYNNYGIFLAELNRPHAEEVHRRAMAVQTELCNRYPLVASYQRALAKSHINLAALLVEFGKSEEADSQLKAALDVGLRLIQKYPEVPDYLLTVGRTYLLIAQNQRLTDNLTLATSSIESALQYYDEAERLSPLSPHQQYNLIELIAENGIIDWGLGNFDQAESHFLKAIGMTKELEARYNTTPNYMYMRMRSWTNLCTMYWSQKDFDKSTEAATEMVAIGQQLKDTPFSTTPLFRKSWANGHNQWATSLASLGEYDDAIGAYTESIREWQRLADESKNKIEYRVGLGGGYVNLGSVLRRKGKYVEAIWHIQTAREILEGCVQSHPDWPQAHQFLRNAKIVRAQTISSFEGRVIQMAKNSEFDKATDAVEQLVQPPNDGSPVRGDSYFTAACIYARLFAYVKSADINSTVDPAVEDYAKRALELLKLARDDQYFDNNANLESLRKDAKLDAIRDTEEFSILIKDLETNR